MSRVTTAEAKKCFTDGWRLNRRGQHRKAAAVFRVGLRQSPTSAQGWLGLGHALSELGYRRAACRAFERAAALRPSFDLASSALFHSLLDVGKFSKARREALRFLELVRAGHATGERTLLKTYEGFEGPWRAFLEDLRAQRADPVGFRAGQQAIKALFENPVDPKRVARLLRRAVALEDGRAQAWLGGWLVDGVASTRGVVLIKKNPAEGVRLLRKAASSGILEATVRLAECYASGNGVRKNPRTAIALLRNVRGSSIDPDTAWRIALVYRELGEKALERRWVRRAGPDRSDPSPRARG